MTQMPIKLLIADDHIVLRQGLCEMLEADGRFQVVGQASDGEEMLQKITECKPDVVIMDVLMPKLDGIGAMERMKDAKHEVPVVILSANEGERNVRAALKAGAKGYLPKYVALEELQFAIQSVVEGNTYLSPAITTTLVNSSGGNDISKSALDLLTKREVEILKYLAEGMPNREIGKLLHISTRTVDTHRTNILKKLNLKTNAELVRLAITEGLTNI